MSPWASRRTESLVMRARRFVDALEAHPGWRRRLMTEGYSQAAHRELQALIAEVTTGWEPERTRGRRRRERLLPGARGVGAWAGEQARLASGAVRKVPAVLREAGGVLRRARRRERAPAELLREAWRVARRVGRDEHLSHFLTVAGFRDARSALVRRVQDGGTLGAEQSRQQAAYALSYALARWRDAARRVFGDEVDVLRGLGMNQGGSGGRRAPSTPGDPDV